jgi:SagB-type dehydrogenase family enzyme
MKHTALSLLLAAAMATLTICATAQDARPPELELPPPRTGIGLPLMEALAKRNSSREFSPEALPDQVLSDLLWAAFGVNRPASGMRTAPSAVNWQEIDIYVATANGLYLFNATAHRLIPLLNDDIRAAVGIQQYPATAPVVLIYVADFSKMKRASDQDKEFYSAADTGFISQNVYLYCASEDLATCVIGLIKRKSLAQKLNLQDGQKIILAQPVGYPPNPPGEE